ncbi:MAG: hypothetical protein UCJ19_11560, partial [Oscillospiraceae bacterium]|nr:hypothetical protein [Oscillospiraceae bacterium]
SAGLPFLKKRKQKTSIPATAGHWPEPSSTMPKLSAGLPFLKEKEAKDFYFGFGCALAGTTLHNA